MAALIGPVVDAVIGSAVGGLENKVGGVVSGVMSNVVGGLLNDPVTEEAEFAGDRIEEDSKMNTVIASQEATLETSMIQESGVKKITDETSTADTVGSMKGMTERWIKIQDMTWTTNQAEYTVFNNQLVSYPNDILSKNAAFQSFFTFFNYFTCDLKFKVILTATKFQQGAVYVCYSPNIGSTSTDSMAFIGPYFSNIRMLPHTILNVQNATSGTFKVPYNNTYPLFNRNTDRPRGYIFGGVWSQLVVGDGAPTEIPVALYASVEGLKVKAMGKEKTPFATKQYLAIRRAMLKSLETMDFSDRNVALIQQILYKMREEYPLAFAEVDVFNVSTHIFNTANISQKETFLNDLSFVGDVRERDDTVTSTKPITFPELMAIPMPISDFAWKVTDNPGDILFETPLAPLCFPNWKYVDEEDVPAVGKTRYLEHRECMIDYVAKFANFWRGDLKFDFEFFNPGLMKGRVKIGILFGEHPYEDSENNYFITHDLGLEDKAQLVVPFNVWRDWMQVPSITQKFMENTVITKGLTDKMLDGYSIGTLGVTVVNSLSSNNTMANFINIKVNVSSDNLQFAYPARSSQHHEASPFTRDAGYLNYTMLPFYRQDAHNASLYGLYPDFPPHVYGETPGYFPNLDDDDEQAYAEADFTGSFAAQTGVNTNTGDLETSGPLLGSYLPNHITMKNLLKRPVLIAQGNVFLGDENLPPLSWNVSHEGNKDPTALLFGQSVYQGITEIGLGNAYAQSFDWGKSGDQWKSWPWLSGLKPWFEHSDVCKLGSYYSGSCRLHVAISNIRTISYTLNEGSFELDYKFVGESTTGPLIYITFNDGVVFTERDMMFNGAYIINTAQQKMASFRIPYYQISQQKRITDTDLRWRIFVQNCNSPINFNIRVWMTWEDDFELYFPKALPVKRYYAYSSEADPTPDHGLLATALEPRDLGIKAKGYKVPVWVDKPPNVLNLVEDLTICGDVESNPGPVKTIDQRKAERNLVRPHGEDFPLKMQRMLYSHYTDYGTEGGEAVKKSLTFNDFQAKFPKVECKVWYNAGEEGAMQMRTILVIRNESNQYIYGDTMSDNIYSGMDRNHKKKVRAEYVERYKRYIGKMYPWFNGMVEDELKAQKEQFDAFADEQEFDEETRAKHFKLLLENMAGFQVEGLFDSFSQTTKFITNITNAVSLINRVMGFKQSMDEAMENAKKKYFTLFVKLLLAIANIAMNPTASCFALTVSSLLIDMADLIPGISERISTTISAVITKVFTMLKPLTEKKTASEKAKEAAYEKMMKESRLSDIDEEGEEATAEVEVPVTRGIITIIVEAFYNIFGINVGSKATHITNILKVFKDFAIVGGGIRGASQIVDLIVKAGYKVLSYFSDGFTEEERTNAWFRKNKAKCLQWHVDYIDFTTTYDPCLILTDEIKKNALSNLMAFGKEIYEHCLDSDVRNTTFTIYRNAFTDVKKMFLDMVKAVHGSKSRPEPVVVYLFGDNGTGKSVLATKMAKEMSAFFDAKNFYSMPPNPKYFDGYAAQSVVVMDDLGQHREEADYALFCQMISTAPFICPMASLTEKGTSFTSPVVIATSNLNKPKPLTLMDSGAVHRRFTYKVKVEMRDEYETQTGQMKGKFDVQAANEDMSLRTGKCWNLTSMNNDFDNGTPISYMNLLNKVKQEVVRRRIVFDGVQERSIVAPVMKYGRMLAEARGDVHEPVIWEGASTSAEAEGWFDWLWTQNAPERLTEVESCEHGCPQFVTINLEDVCIDGEVIKPSDAVTQTAYIHMRDKDDVDPDDHEWVKPYPYVKCDRCKINTTQCRRCWYYMAKRDDFVRTYFDMDKINTNGRDHYVKRCTKSPFVEIFLTAGANMGKAYSIAAEQNDYTSYHEFQYDASCARHLDMANKFLRETDNIERSFYIAKVLEIVAKMILIYALIDMVAWGWEMWFGAKGDVYENGSGKKAKKSAVKVKAKVTGKPITEGAEDKESRISKNQYFVTMCSDKTDYGRGMITFLDDRTIMTCNHLFLCDDGDKLTHMKYKDGNATCKIPLNIDKVTRIELAGMATDIAIIGLDYPFPGVRDITKHFVTEEEAKYIETHPVHLLSRKNDERRVVEAPYCKLYLQQSYSCGSDTYEHSAILKYATSDRGPGDSGGLVTSCNSHFAGKVIGMHVAGTRSSGWAVPLTNALVTEMVMVAAQSRSEHNFQSVELPKEFDEEEVSADMRMAYCDGKSKHIGQAPRPCNVARKHDFSKSPIHGMVLPVLRAPAPMSKGDKRVDPEHRRDPLENMPKKYNGDQGCVNPIFLNNAVDFCGNIFYEGGRTQQHGVLTQDEAINGLGMGESMEQIPMSTSPGYPYSLDNGGLGKYPFFDVVEEKENGQKRYAAKPDLQARIEERRKLARDRKRIDGSYFQTAIKSELRPHAKIRVNGARTIEGCPLDFLVLFRQYLGACANWMTRNFNNESGSSVGCDPDVDWTTFLAELEMYKKHFAVDFVNWDGNIPPEYVLAASKVINRFYDGVRDAFDRILTKGKRVVPKVEEWKKAYEEDPTLSGFHLTGDKVADDNIRDTLMNELAFTVSVVGGQLVISVSGVPSGHPITALLNSIIHWLKYCVAYQEATVDVPHLNSLKILHDESTKKFYGDDGVYGVSERISKVFSRMELARTSEKEGMKCTMEDKSETLTPFSNLNDMTYLKRRFIRCESDAEMVLAPIEERTIGSLLNWVRRDALFEDNVKDACWFAYHHGKEYYDDFVKKTRAALDEVGLAFPMLTWNEHHKNHMVKFAKLDGTWRKKPVVPAWQSAKSRMMIQNHYLVRKLKDMGKSVEEWNPYLLGTKAHHYCSCDRIVFGKLDGKCLYCLGIDNIPEWYEFCDRDPKRCIELERHHILGEKAWDPRHGDGPGGGKLNHHKCSQCRNYFLHLTQRRTERICLPCLGIDCPDWFTWTPPKLRDRKEELMLSGDIETNPGPQYVKVVDVGMHSYYEDAGCNKTITTCLLIQVPDMESILLHFLFNLLLGVVFMSLLGNLYKFAWKAVISKLGALQVAHPAIEFIVRAVCLGFYLTLCSYIVKFVCLVYAWFVSLWIYGFPVWIFISLRR